MDKAMARLKVEWERNPLQVIAVAALAATAAAKLLSASTESRNARVWAKEVDRRDRMSRR